MNPYDGLPDARFWSRAVARPLPEAVDPVGPAPFTISRADLVATAGSCFAQHIAATLLRTGFAYHVTEPGPAERNFGVFPARFGNVYTTRQLLQLFQRAYGLFEPRERAWTRPDGRLVDPFRPRVEPDGFATLEALEADRLASLAATRAMFEAASVFIFTLGLTEGWHAAADGAAVPLAPGVAGGADRLGAFAFHNSTVAEMTADLRRFIQALRVVNPGVRVMLTVSPVPLVATFEDSHVLPATVYSKSALRVAAEEVSRSVPLVAYFPSYEIITGHHAAYRWFAPDLREVLPAGVDHVMGLFRRHYLSDGLSDGAPAAAPLARERQAPEGDEEAARDLAALYRVVCDEEAIEPPGGAGR